MPQRSYVISAEVALTIVCMTLSRSRVAVISRLTASSASSSSTFFSASCWRALRSARTAWRARSWSSSSSSRRELGVAAPLVGQDEGADGDLVLDERHGQDRNGWGSRGSRRRRGRSAGCGCGGPASWSATTSPTIATPDGVRRRLDVVVLVDGRAAETSRRSPVEHPERGHLRRHEVGGLADDQVRELARCRSSSRRPWRDRRDSSAARSRGASRRSCARRAAPVRGPAPPARGSAPSGASASSAFGISVK